jgi:hypothetical protein
MVSSYLTCTIRVQVRVALPASALPAARAAAAADGNTPDLQGRITGPHLLFAAHRGHHFI